MDKIKNLRMHEETGNPYLKIMRVPGGLIYNFYQMSNEYNDHFDLMSSTFVPFTGFTTGD